MTNRREYTAEFKLEAVKLVKETGQASTKIAKDLGSVDIYFNQR
ncbi:hypothetical protein wHma_10610 [Wolbachia pipientis]|nr:transposase [Wolbachia endosymbiont (group A) of Cheilosia soror]GKS79054.1 hypothetical protein wHma_10610 [Wolbachia pipientis]